MQYNTGGYELIPKTELIKILQAMKACESIEDTATYHLMMKHIEAIAKASAGAGKERLTNKAADRKRLLVGARIPRYLAERYRETAKKTHRSLYEFVCDALKAEYRKSTEDELTRCI